MVRLLANFVLYLWLLNAGDLLQLYLFFFLYIYKMWNNKLMAYRKGYSVYIGFFKGCLRYKKITFHSLRIFLFRRKVMFSRYSSFHIFNHPMIYKSLTSWWLLAHETKCIFEYIFLNHNSLSHQTWPIDIYKQGQ